MFLLLFCCLFLFFALFGKELLSIVHWDSSTHFCPQEILVSEKDEWKLSDRNDKEIAICI